MYDFSELFKVSAEAGPTILLVVMGLVQMYGKFGVSGNMQLVSSLLTGLVFGGGFQMAVLGVPTEFAGWFSVSVFGILMGLVASGVYEVGKKLTSNLAKG